VGTGSANGQRGGDEQGDQGNGSQHPSDPDVANASPSERDVKRDMSTSGTSKNIGPIWSAGSLSAHGSLQVSACRKPLRLSLKLNPM
jgi:hypothetical protein